MATSSLTPEDEQSLKIHRSLALTGALVLVGFGVARRVLDPTSTDPLLERLALAAVLCVFAVLTFVDGPVRRHPHVGMAVAICLVSAWILRYLARSGLSVDYSYGLIMLLFAGSLGFRTRLSLAAYLAVMVGALWLLLLRSPESGIAAMPFIGTLVAVSVLTYAVQANRLALEQQLRRAKSLAEAAVAARGQFLANMSHEIRTPMNGVLGMATLLEHTELTDTQRDYVQTIQMSGDALLKLINDILDLSKAEAGRLELEQRPFEVVACAQGAVDLLAPLARQKGLQIHCEFASSIPEQLIGDALRLRQVLVNLLGNAIKFTERGDVRLEMDGEPLAGARYRLCCAVHDTGIGIAPDQVDALFEPFVQGDPSTTRRHGGTGLGLSICKQIVERMQGSIRAEGRPGAGSVLRFEVCLALPQQPDEP